MPLNLEDLRQQKASIEKEFEEVKALTYRTQGALTLISHLLAEAEKPENPSTQDESPVSAS